MVDGLEEREKKRVNAPDTLLYMAVREINNDDSLQCEQSSSVWCCSSKKIQKVSRQQETEAHNATAAVHFFSLKKPTF